MLYFSSCNGQKLLNTAFKYFTTSVLNSHQWRIQAQRVLLDRLMPPSDWDGWTSCWLCASKVKNNNNNKKTLRKGCTATVLWRCRARLLTILYLHRVYASVYRVLRSVGSRAPPVEVQLDGVVHIWKTSTAHWHATANLHHHWEQPETCHHQLNIYTCLNLERMCGVFREGQYEENEIWHYFWPIKSIDITSLILDAFTKYFTHWAVMLI